MNSAALARVVSVAIAIGLLGMISMANSPASSQSLIGDELSAENDPYSTYYRNGAYGPTGKGLAAHSGRRLPHRRHRSGAPAHSGPIYGAWKAPYELPSGLGPNDIPFAPF